MGKSVFYVPNYGQDGRSPAVQSLEGTLRDAGYAVTRVAPRWGRHYTDWVKNLSYRYGELAEAPNVVLAHSVGCFVACAAIHLAHRRSGIQSMPSRLILASPSPCSAEYNAHFTANEVNLPPRVFDALGMVSMRELMYDVRHEVAAWPLVMVGSMELSGELSGPSATIVDEYTQTVADILKAERQVITGAGSNISHPAYTQAIVDAIG